MPQTKPPSNWIKSPRVQLAGIGKEHKCPHCGYYNHGSNPIRGCANCKARWAEYRGKYYYAPKATQQGHEDRPAPAAESEDKSQ